MRLLATALLLLTATAVHAADGTVRIPSSYDVATTIDRLEQTLRDKGMTVFARIDHAAGARRADLKLRPTELLIFGNPKVGTPLMQCSQVAALDLPQKALAWRDAEGKVWLAYNDPAYLGRRHDIAGDCAAALAKVSGALRRFATSAAGSAGGAP